MDAWNLITLYGLYYVLRDVNRSDLGWNRGGFVPRSAFMDLDLDLKPDRHRTNVLYPDLV